MDRGLCAKQRPVVAFCCPKCDQPMRFDYAAQVGPTGKITLCGEAFRLSLRMHLTHGCLGAEE
jgi:hypothetical protein